MHLFRLSLLSMCLVLSVTFLCFLAVINLIELLVGLGVFHTAPHFILGHHAKIDLAQELSVCLEDA